MKAYAVRWDGAYFIVYAPTAARAKGLVIRCAAHAWRRPPFATLECRRWPAQDGVQDYEEAQELGTPGERDDETGVRYGMPDPFVEARP